VGNPLEAAKGFETTRIASSATKLKTLRLTATASAPERGRPVEAMMRALRDNNQVCTRMGAYKPRTSTYSFQGHGRACLPYVFELAGKYGIKIIAMEITHESHIDEFTKHCARRARRPG